MPKKRDPSKKKFITTSVRLPTELVEHARKAAAAEDRSLNSFIVHRLRVQVAAHQRVDELFAASTKKPKGR